MAGNRVDIRHGMTCSNFSTWKSGAKTLSNRNGCNVADLNIGYSAVHMMEWTTSCKVHRGILDTQVGLGLEVGYMQSDCHNFTVALGEEIVELEGIACSGSAGQGGFQYLARCLPTLAKFTLEPLFQDAFLHDKIGQDPQDDSNAPFRRCAQWLMIARGGQAIEHRRVQDALGHESLIARSIEPATARFNEL
jgi:hypothetical protein